MDNINMTDDELNLLSEKVLARLIEGTQNSRWHQMSSPMTVGELLKGQLPFKESEEEMLIAELARLTTLLNLYENNEEFMKAAIIKRKLEIIQNKLDKL